MKILGISGLYHDSAAALTIDGEIVAAIQEERLTRVKGDARFPNAAIGECLNIGGLTPAELDAVVYYDNPMLTYQRFIQNIRHLGSDAKEIIDMQFNSLFSQKLWIHKLVDNAIGMPGLQEKLLVTKHHVAHAASAFYPSPYEASAILTLDGVGEWTTTAIGIGDRNSVKLLRQIEYPHSLGLLYSAFTYFCGFKVNSGEYKLMGLAPYGEPRYADMIRNELINIKEDGSFRINLEHFSFYSGAKMTNSNFDSLFGGAERKPESPITQREMDLAASIQSVTEEVLIKLAKTAKKLTNSNCLCLAGGIALNCVANGKLQDEKIFDHIWIQPAAGDAGGALGAALYAEYMFFDGKRKTGTRDSQKGSYLGTRYAGNQIENYLKAVGAAWESLPQNKLFERTAELIASGKIVGVFLGRMEYGPRALGARSILADARNPEMQVKLNMSIKYREGFRPFAPLVLAEHASEYFDSDMESPYMLFVRPVKESRREPFDISSFMQSSANANEYIDLLPVVRAKRSDIPAVTHIDYSARLQTINKMDNPVMHGLVQKFYEITGCPVLINTSFNVRGEPIVESPKNAYECFMNTEMDALVFDDMILLKEKQPKFEWITKGGGKFVQD